MQAVLSIAGSDSSGGAGIQADIKTIEALGLFAETAITAITAQNTTGVFASVSVEPDLISQQIDCVYTDIRPAAVKIGMVAVPEAVVAIRQALEHHAAKNIVLDPVMVATSGAKLISPEAISTLKESLFPLARIITPNFAEAEILSGQKISTPEDQDRVAEMLYARYHCAVLVKGGHAEGKARDVLVDEEGIKHILSCERVNTANTHGTGCTLSSAIAVFYAQGYTTLQAVERAKDYLTHALEADLNLGAGSGPLDHMYFLRENALR
ncbi:MAG: bifunctional hydroxymethylpyrimidine kinase/phosphomethylpyrimidine kinase [Eggerthellaceae bacterium]|jgi:hydroxymethylpyrimidine/phosphomethylpyrimidine kinase